MLTSPPTTHTGPDRLTIKISEAAATLGICRRQVYRFVSTGELTAICIGRGQRITVASIRAFIGRGGVQLDCK